PDRLARAVQGASGFLYLISRLGVTGARDEVPADLADHVARVRSASALPLAVGFGIATPAQARATARLADGVVVGSAIVDALAAGGLGAAERLVRQLAAAIREGTACPPTVWSRSTVGHSPSADCSRWARPSSWTRAGPGSRSSCWDCSSPPCCCAAGRCR